MFNKYSIADIQQKMINHEMDPIDIAEECSNRYFLTEPLVKAWVCFDPKALFEKVESIRTKIQKRELLRPLDGVPVGIKDIFNTIDFPTQMGSPLWKNFTPGNDARPVYYIKNSGGAVVGKTITAEFAVHALNETLNPHDSRFTPGTSSSGSAVAVSAGVVPVALGTQTAGSIIRPASFCGVYAFKPSFGLIPRTGTLKTTDSLDTIGFFTAFPADLKRVFEILRVRGPNFPFSHNALSDSQRQTKSDGERWRIAFVKTYTWNDTADYAKNGINELISRIANIVNVDVSEVELPNTMDKCHFVHESIYNKTLSYYFKEEKLNSHLVSEIMNVLIESGNNISTKAYHDSLRDQCDIINIMDKFFDNYDIIISLSTAGSAPLRNDFEIADPCLMWTLSHLPVINIPAFISPTKMPFGAQILARKYNDLLLLNFLDVLQSNAIVPKSCNPTPAFLDYSHSSSKAN